MATTLKVISFNVLAQPWIDKRLRHEAQQSSHLTRANRVTRQIEVLRDADADIVLLQEVTPIVMRAFKRELTQYHVPNCFARMLWKPSTSTDPVNGNAVIWRKGLFSDKAKCDIIELDRRLGNRAAMVSGTLSASNERIRVISVHLEWGNLDASSRQFRAIFDGGFVRNHRRVIIGGDFNMGGSSDATFPIGPDIKRHHFIDHSVGMRTHPFAEEASTITHILTRGLSPKRTRVDVGECRSIGECLHRYGSDHYPVTLIMYR